MPHIGVTSKTNTKKSPIKFTAKGPLRKAKAKQKSKIYDAEFTVYTPEFNPIAQPLRSHYNNPYQQTIKKPNSS
jgi:hypothetical protein